MNSLQNTIRLSHKGQHFVGEFRAMASTCEILMETSDEKLARKLTEIAKNEALRIEKKFSRYKTDNIIYQINTANGSAIEVDEETAHLIDYASLCHQLSDGLFDISSGVLRRAWKFDNSITFPTPSAIDALIPFIGWQKVNWQKPILTMPKRMEIDLGGIGKEYAVDKTLNMLINHSDIPVLVNFGGDLAVSGSQLNGAPWQVGIETPDDNANAKHILEISAGALATSGDAKRYLLHQGKRYGHILNPKTGYPIEQAPRSITVAGSTCVQAGTLSTLAMLQGAKAEEFLTNQQTLYWCLR